jgi:hypothetical protein
MGTIKSDRFRKFQDKQPPEPKSEPTTKNLQLENSNIA